MKQRTESTVERDRNIRGTWSAAIGAVRSAALVSSVAILAGCATHLPPTASLGRPSPRQTVYGGTAWIRDVKISDRAVKQLDDTRGLLATNICTYVADSGFFRAAKLGPGTVGERDVVLNIDFERYRAVWNIHPACVPVSVLTFTMYFWVGAPVLYDELDFSARMTASDSRGRVLCEATHQEVERENYSVYQGTDFVEERTAVEKAARVRTAVLAALLEETTSRLARMERPHPAEQN